MSISHVTLHFRQKQINIIHGDITQIQADAIASSDDRSLSMGGGVSQAIRRIGGDIVWRESRDLLPIQLGATVVTSAGDLPAKYVIHTAVLDDISGKQSDTAVIVHVTKACLHEAILHGCRSLALPAFATGAGKVKSAIVAHTMLKTLMEEWGAETCLHTIYIVLYSRTLFVEFLTNSFETLPRNSHETVTPHIHNMYSSEQDTMSGMKEPPWKMLEMPKCSMGWRMGGGEDCLHEWHTWFKQLLPQEQQAYMLRYPEPEDWFAFYQRSLTTASSYHDDEYVKISERAIQQFRAYIDLNYQLGMLHGEAEHYACAVEYLGNAIYNILNYQIWDKDKTHNAFAHYQMWKHALSQEMANDPCVQDGWALLAQTPHRLRLVPQQTVISQEAYQHIEERVFFPSQLGRTWIKHFGNHEIHIHHHWKEPCLFLVRFQQDSEGFHIADAWMNLSSGVTYPSGAPTQEPELLLTWLLGRFIKYSHEQPETHKQGENTSDAS